MKQRQSDDLRDRFRTLDDPPERAAAAAPRTGPYPFPPIASDEQRWNLPIGHWRVNLTKRPGLWRRFWAWALLGYRWHHYSD
jgi:hypothetical protein